jgi:hypothetical protein
MSEKGKKNHETFHILKMKTHFEKEPHFGNENTILRMGAHSKTYFENENMFFEK